MIIHPYLSRHLVSIPSLHAAQALLKQFRFVKTEEGKIDPVEKNIAVIIDVCTQVFRFGKAMREITQQLPWQKKDDLARNMLLLKQALQAINEVSNRLENYGRNEPNPQPRLAGGYQISAAALHASRTLFYQFDLEEIGKVAATENNVAIVVDVFTQVFRIEELLRTVTIEHPWVDPDVLRYNLSSTQDAMNALDLLRRKLPNYGLPVEVTELDRTQVENNITTAQHAALNEVTEHLSKSFATEDRQRVLRQAGLYR